MQTAIEPVLSLPSASGRTRGQFPGRKIPARSLARESLREKGQFWTPQWLARIMASWVTSHAPHTLFDPATGPGTFFAAARSIGYSGKLEGFEAHASALAESEKNGLRDEDLLGVKIADFLSTNIAHDFPAIISNPPYIRHHRLDECRKAELKKIATRSLGFALDGRAGIHVYFLLKCLEHLAPCGRLAFLLPADVCEGVSSSALWSTLCGRYRLDGVLTFEETAAPFPGIDTNALVLFLTTSAPRDRFVWIRARQRNERAILEALGVRQSNWAANPIELPRNDSTALTAHPERELSEALSTGLSRPPRPAELRGTPLSHFARVMRGVATGSNEFFFLTHAQLDSFGLDPRYFTRALGRTRDCSENILTASKLEALETASRPTWLLNLDGAEEANFPAALKSYLQSGVRQKLHLRPLIKTRRPWYKMERRVAPPILFAYLGRRDCRFILNEARVVPLTGFLCIYPYDNSPAAVEKLWRALNDPITQRNLVFTGKSYGGGAVKVEPRQLEKLLIPLRAGEEL
jgi:hypothetical protein